MTAAGTFWWPTPATRKRGNSKREATSTALGQLQGGAPYGAAVDHAGNFYVTDEEPIFPSQMPHILELAPDGTTTVIAGNGPDGFSGDGGPATWPFSTRRRAWRWTRPAISMSPITATTACVRSTRQGTSTRSRGTAMLNSPATTARRPRLEWIPSILHWIARETFWWWISSTIASARSRQTIPLRRWWEPACRATPGDGGPAAEAHPQLADRASRLDGSGNMYIADQGNAVVRRVTAGGLITTIAGNGTLTPSSGDGGPATAAQLDPFSVAVDAAGNVYVTDSFNDHVRMLTPQTVKPASMSIVSGNGQSATVETGLAAPLVLKITDSTGAGVPGVVVTFTVSPEGAATVTPSPALTLNDGTVTATITLGSDPGALTITASSARLANVTFSLTALASNSPSISAGGIASAGLSTPLVKRSRRMRSSPSLATNFAPAGTAQHAGGWSTASFPPI